MKDPAFFAIVLVIALPVLYAINYCGPAARRDAEAKLQQQQSTHEWERQERAKELNQSAHKEWTKMTGEK